MTHPIVTVANLSPLRQSRWLRVPMPVSQADKLPQHAIVDGIYIATKAERLGCNTQLWCVHMDTAGHASGALQSWKPWPEGVAFPKFQLTDWVTDNVAKTALRVKVISHSHLLDGTEIPLAFTAVEFQNDAVQVWRLEGHVSGWHCTAYAHLWSGQDVIDIGVREVWSDTRSKSARPGYARIILTSGGEPIASWLPTRNSHHQIDQNTIEVYDGPVVDGYPVLWRGVMGALPKDVAAADERRLANVWAAHGGPVVGSCRFPDGEWLAFGARPSVPQEPHKDRWLEYAQGYSDYAGQRPLALGLHPGGTGDQSPFGATNGLPAAGGAVWQVPLLLHAASDPRAVHCYELDGTPITKANHPGRQTWECLTQLHETNPDRLGKDLDGDQPHDWKWIEAAGEGRRYIGMDDQHNGLGVLLASYALTGDYLLRDEILRYLDVIEARAFPARWRHENPSSWLDAPRATGRLLQALAKAMTVLGAEQRTRLNAIALKELEMWSAYRRSLPAGAVKLWRINDPRVIGGDRVSQMPWQDSIYVMGCLEMAYARRRVGLAGPHGPCPFMDEAIAIGRMVIEHAVVTTPWGTMLPITGLLASESGDAQDAAYYQYPRDKAGTTPLAGNDMMVGDAGWWAWYAGAIVAAMHGPRDAVYDRARAIYDTHGPHSPGADREWVEWWAIKVPGGAT